MRVADEAAACCMCDPAFVTFGRWQVPRNCRESMCTELTIHFLCYPYGGVYSNIQISSQRTCALCFCSPPSSIPEISTQYNIVSSSASTTADALTTPSPFRLVVPMLMGITSSRSSFQMNHDLTVLAAFYKEPKRPDRVGPAAFQCLRFLDTARLRLTDLCLVTNRDMVASGKRHRECFIG